MLKSEDAAEAGLALVENLEPFFFNDTATTEIYTLSLHDALPIWVLPDEATPPQLIMLQFSLGDFRHARRAYWGTIGGTPCEQWDPDGTQQMLHMGPVPKPGQ